MDAREHNRRAWDAQVEQGNEWTVPVGPELVERARRGDVHVVLTPTRPVPREWLGDLRDRDVLCLASGGGQQGPLFAAAGARVTTLDNSPRQLDRDREVAEREGLALETCEGDMADLSRFGDGRFDLVFNACSACFVPDVRAVWRECFRVLRPGGELLAGLVNPLRYVFDLEPYERGEMVVRFRIPFADTEQLPRETLAARLESGEPLEFGHGLEDLIGGQLQAGFALTGFYEDGYAPGTQDALNEHLPTFFATRAQRPPGARPRPPVGGSPSAASRPGRS